jgi:hypothetical protein
LHSYDFSSFTPLLVVKALSPVIQRIINLISAISKSALRFVDTVVDLAQPYIGLISKSPPIIETVALDNYLNRSR